MGIVYCGPYADAINQGERWEHEGYADRKMPGGEFSNGEWSLRYPWEGPGAHVAFVAACACGWRSTTEHPPTDQGEQAATDEWERDHLQPLIDTVARRHTVTGEVLLAFTRDLRAGLTTTTGEDGEGVLTEHSRGLRDAVARLEDLLDQLDRTADQPCSLGGSPASRVDRTPGAPPACERGEAS